MFKLENAIEDGKRVLQLMQEEHDDLHSLHGSSLKKALQEIVKKRGGVTFTSGLVQSV